DPGRPAGGDGPRLAHASRGPALGATRGRGRDLSFVLVIGLAGFVARAGALDDAAVDDDPPAEQRRGAISLRPAPRLARRPGRGHHRAERARPPLDERPGAPRAGARGDRAGHAFGVADRELAGDPAGAENHPNEAARPVEHGRDQRTTGTETVRLSATARG